MSFTLPHRPALEGEQNSSSCIIMVSLMISAKFKCCATSHGTWVSEGHALVCMNSAHRVAAGDIATRSCLCAGHPCGRLLVANSTRKVEFGALRSF